MGVLALAADKDALDTAVVLNRMLRQREVVEGMSSRLYNNLVMPLSIR